MTNAETTTPGVRVYPSGYRCRLLCVVFLVAGTLRGTLADDSPAGPAESRSVEGGPSGRGQRSSGHSSRIDARNNSPALNNFLEDVLGAQEELKWIDRAVNREPGGEDRGAFSGEGEKYGNQKSRREYGEQPRKPYEPQRINPEDDAKTKREVETDEKTASSLASLKRTILELSDSLNPRPWDEDQGDNVDAFESKRKLLWSEDMKSAIGVAIEYYDYEDGADSAAAMLDNPAEREAKREDSPSPLAGPPQIQKKDENSEQEQKEERERQKLTNKHPKQEFISETDELRPDAAASGGKKYDAAASPPSSPHNSMMLKRIPAAAVSDDSDFYSQCKVGSLLDECEEPESDDENPIIHERHSLIDTGGPDVAAANDEERLSGERTYVVISPGVERKRSRKRSVDPMESSSVDGTDSPWASSRADKSARNYFALKITDDMFKGGVEQSNPLGEDNPIEGMSFSSSAASASSPSSAAGNASVALRSHKPKTTSTEWKVIEAVDSQKMSQPEAAMQPERVFGRRLAQIISEDPPGHANFSSVSPSPPTDNLLYSATLTHRHSSFANESTGDIDVTTHRESPDKLGNFQEVHHVDSAGRTNFSTIHRETVDQQNKFQVYNTSAGGSENISTTLQLLALTTAQSDSSTMRSRDSNDSHNNTRLRRHASLDGHEGLPKNRRDGIQYENVREGVEGRKRLSNDATETDSQHPKLTVLLAADNIEDESQIDLAVHGELAGKIVGRIFEEVQRNEGLKVALGPGLYRNHKPQESIALDKMYRQGLDEDEVKETEAMMRRVMELLGRLVLDEVRRKTCASLAPDMRDFLQWTLGTEDLSEPPSDQVPPLPLIPADRLHEATDRHPPSADKFLFQSTSDDLSELERKVALLKSLINEYRALTEREKTKVQTVHDYLVRQLALLMKYIESKEAASQGRVSEKSQTAGARVPPGRQHILQYQGSIPNQNFTESREKDFNTTGREATDEGIDRRMIGAGPSIFSYFNGNSNERGLQNDRKKRKHESFERSGGRRGRIRNRSTYNAGESLEYRKLLRRIASLRRKKREDSWGYEVPRIYNGPVELPSLPRISLPTVADLDQPVTPFGHSGPAINSSTPVRGKNRLEDEVLLLNKREAWRKENERLLEEVAFGKDTRNDLIPGGQRRLFNPDEEVRMKRGFGAKKSTISSTTTGDTLKTNETSNYHSQTENLRSIERKINVFPVEDKNTTSDASEINLMTSETSGSKF